MLSTLGSAAADAVVPDVAAAVDAAVADAAAAAVAAAAVLDKTA